MSVGVIPVLRVGVIPVDDCSYVCSVCGVGCLGIGITGCIDALYVSCIIGLDEVTSHGRSCLGRLVGGEGEGDPLGGVELYGGSSSGFFFLRDALDRIVN